MPKPKLIGYSHTYPIGSTGQFQKIWIELELDENDDPRQALYSAKKTVTDFFFESNKAAGKQVKEEEQPKSNLTQEEQMIKDIGTCTSSIVLKAVYGKLAKNYPAIQEAYDKKLKELNG